MRKDIPKLLAAVRNFVNAPRNIYTYRTPYVGRDNSRFSDLFWLQSSEFETAPIQT
jgi:hypothetical protein